MVDHIYLYNASIQMIKKIIDRGDLGNLIHLSFYRTNLGPIRTDVSALWDLTTHDVSILNNFINKKYKKIVASGFKRKAPKFMIWSMLLLNTTTYLLLFFLAGSTSKKES